MITVTYPEASFQRLVSLPQGKGWHDDQHHICQVIKLGTLILTKMDEFPEKLRTAFDPTALVSEFFVLFLF